jgi:hypothetical protein
MTRASVIPLLEAIEPDEARVLLSMDSSGIHAANHLSAALRLDLERVEIALRRLAQRDLVFAIYPTNSWVGTEEGEQKLETLCWRVKRDLKPPFEWGGKLALLEAIEPDEFLVFLHMVEQGFQAPHISSDILGLTLERVEAVLGRLVQRGLIFRIDSCVFSEDGERKYEPASWWLKRDLYPQFERHRGLGHLFVVDGIEFDDSADGDEEEEDE